MKYVKKTKWHDAFNKSDLQNENESYYFAIFTLLPKYIKSTNLLTFHIYSKLNLK